MQFNPLYTGRSSAAQFPELDALERSQQKASQLAIAGEEKKLSKFLKDKDTFQKMLAIDPIVAVSQKNAETQAGKLKDYNDKWVARYAQREGKLSFEDEVEMARDKSLLQAEQAQILADQEQYKRAKGIHLSDTRGYYDKDHFLKKEQEYFDTGKLPRNILNTAPRSIVNYLSSLKPLTEIGSTKEVDVTDARGNVVGKRIVDVKEGRTKEQAQYAILEAMQEEPYLKSVLKDFESLSEEEQMAVVGDYDGSGVVDPADVKYAYNRTDIRDNPIAKWAMNNETYLAAAMGRQESASKPIATKGKGGSGLNISFGGKQMDVSPAYARNAPVVYGDKHYNKSFAFPGKIQVPSVRTEGGIMFEEDMSSDIGPGNVQGYIKDYIPGEDIVIVEVTKGYPDLSISTGGLIAVPAGNVEDINNLPVKSDGQTITIGQLRGSKATQPAVKSSGLKWK